jgi:hypothetical protein
MNYKVGDTVYFCSDNQVKQGIIWLIEYDHPPEYPIIVRTSDGNAYAFTEDGYYVGEEKESQRLSFTPFEIKVIGATYERPEPEIPIDTMVWVKHNNHNNWEVRFYSHKKDGMHYCFDCQKKSNQAEGEAYPWSYLSIECPLK